MATFCQGPLRERKRSRGARKTKALTLREPVEKSSVTLRHFLRNGLSQPVLWLAKAFRVTRKFSAIFLKKRANPRSAMLNDFRHLLKIRALLSAC
jgi:hypothetical protein